MRIQARVNHTVLRTADVLLADALAVFLTTGFLAAATDLAAVTALAAGFLAVVLAFALAAAPLGLTLSR